ncbi:hypothetical protein [uncultured Nonlabens sp.]|uniref:hypothetical protein n=1 Tax=uncultured Nonlabens sp. TaxID=859306 RepID=UPI002607CA23|nr:hypothetical protein [uncultured Nonlabens sp.]
MILFGYRNIKLKSYSYTAKELGLPSDNNSKIVIEYRQNYFHLFFIPFFPLNKFLAIEDSEEVGELSKNLENKIKSLIEKKTKAPWYTYLGLILIFIYIYHLF